MKMLECARKISILYSIVEKKKQRVAQNINKDRAKDLKTITKLPANKYLPNEEKHTENKLIFLFIFSRLFAFLFIFWQ